MALGDLRRGHHDELAGQSIKVERYAELAAPGDVLIYQFSTSSMVADLLGGPARDAWCSTTTTSPRPSISWPGSRHRPAGRPTPRTQLAPAGPAGRPRPGRQRIQRGRPPARRLPADGRGPGAGRLPAGGRDPRPPGGGRLAARRTAGGADWLFVGRVVPSKGQHQLVKALWAYRRLYDPEARLHLVGSAPTTST